jgi:NitT/TauT family transport system substrate-binding protein
MHKCVARLAVAGFMGALALTAALPAQAEPMVIRGGVAVYFEGMLPVLAAQEKGYLKAANIDLQMLDFKGGGPTVQAFVGDSLDVCFCAADHVVRLNSRHMPTVVLYGMDDLHDYTLIGKDDLTTANGGIASLKGKAVGITSPASMTDNTARWAIANLKMNPDSDYRLISAGTGASMLAAIETGKVNAGMVVVTDRAVLLKKGGYRIVEDYSKLPYASFSVLAKEAWVKAHPQAARAFIAALTKATADLKKDHAFALSVTKKIYPNLPDDLIEVATNSAISRIPENGKYSAAAVKNLNDIMLAADSTLKPVKPEDLEPKF